MVVKARATFLIGLLIVSLLLPSAILARVNATVDRASLYQGDALILTIETEDQDSEPDFSVLNESFTTGSTSQNQQISFVNGSYSNRTSWQIEIVPLTAKSIVIPSITVGNEKTQPILLNIKQPTVQEQVQTANDIFIKVTAESGEQLPFVQQQIRYSVRLFFRLPLLEGELGDPSVEDAIIEQLGDAERSQAIYNGAEYQVIDRHYAIFPEKSGELTIPPIQFQGRITSNTPKQRRPQSLRDRYFNQRRAQSSRPVQIQSQAITLQVQPQPAQYSGQHWLPSEQLTLKDSWTQSPPEFRAGQPISRTITVEAKGLAASHIPQLTLDTSNHLRIYPGPVETKSATDGTWVYGQSEQKFSYIPSKSGRQSLPAVSLTWWNLTTGQQEISTLPAWQIDVLPPLEGTAQQSEVEQVEMPAPSTTSSETIEPAATNTINGLYLLLSVALSLFLLWVIYYLIKKKGWLKRLLQVNEKREQHTDTLNSLQQACSDSNPTAAKQALLQLTTERWPQSPPTGLSALACRLKTGAAELQTLDHALYAAGSSSWQGDPLWQIFKDGLPIKKPSSTKVDDGLKLLYPN